MAVCAHQVALRDLRSQALIPYAMVRHYGKVAILVRALTVVIVEYVRGVEDSAVLARLAGLDSRTKFSARTRAVLARAR